MGILDRLASALSGKSAAGHDENVYWLYVQCSACGEKIKVRVNLTSDLLQNYDEAGGISGYELHKEILGQRCFKLIYAHLTFDRQRKVIGHEIQGARLLTRQEFEQAD
ncbi:MAG: hypothetical protein AB1566_01840 [Chloroflexota bacterium]